MKRSILSLMLCLVALVGCYREEPDVVISVTPVVEDDFELQIVETTILLKEIIYLTFREFVNVPEVFGLTDNPDQANTRSCPTLFFSGDFPNKLVVLDFGGTTGCTSGVAPNGHNYKGFVSTEFEVPVFTKNPSGEELRISTTGFSIGDNVLSDVSIFFYYDSSTNSYEVRLNSTLTVTNNNFVTTYPASGLDDFGILTVVPNGNDDPNNPITFVDNEFSMSVTSEIITCANTTTGNSSTFCVSTLENMTIRPFVCGCVQDGTLEISDAATCGIPETEYDFDQSAIGPDDPGCDDYILKTDVSSGSTSVFQSTNC